jgi:hypothetical protein
MDFTPFSVLGDCPCPNRGEDAHSKYALSRRAHGRKQ